jgi:hypothetical protein
MMNAGHRCLHICLFERAWPQYGQAVETSWEPYVRGTISQDDAIRATVKAIVGER